MAKILGIHIDEYSRRCFCLYLFQFLYNYPFKRVKTTVLIRDGIDILLVIFICENYFILKFLSEEINLNSDILNYKAQFKTL